MGNTRGRVQLVAAAALTALLTIGVAPITTAPAAADEGVDTTLVAGRPNPLGIHLSLVPRAKLTVSATGAPLEGQRINFYLSAYGPTPVPLIVCSDVTDAAGVATCSGFGVLRDIFFGGAEYRADFYGATIDGHWHWGSDDTVKLLGRQ